MVGVDQWDSSSSPSPPRTSPAADLSVITLVSEGAAVCGNGEELGADVAAAIALLLQLLVSACLLANSAQRSFVLRDAGALLVLATHRPLSIAGPARLLPALLPISRLLPSPQRTHFSKNLWRGHLQRHLQ